MRGDEVSAALGADEKEKRKEKVCGCEDVRVQRAEISAEDAVAVVPQVVPCT